MLCAAGALIGQNDEARISVVGWQGDAGCGETAAVFLKARAGDARPADLLRFLDRAGTEPPSEGDCQ
ncbi:hypothetical protein FHP25_39365 [Vineibacter terrae]|uniref:Uncharacterized protein n=1 Tax=Vineibacter terrae TaxID=2586908 RepID=A0A5C8P801_9HYPH|nr:hypothetical protein FHP25_39365 [Vineibacter terrae]